MDTPDTLNYMIAGYVVFAVITLAYVFSLYKRWRDLINELHVFDEIIKK